MAKATVTQQKKTPDSPQYWEGIGRRKSAIARVRIQKGKEEKFVVNEKTMEAHFQGTQDQKIVRQALQALDTPFDVSVQVSGSGIHAQAEAVRHGLTRAIVSLNPETRPQLKALGFLKRDPRARERQKPGLKRARRARQWRKR
ncbi:MAG: 30S ribosomal protein S9 [Candidatus Yanofskybacteria bacterium]|nr:30S ribosomal protein S9 [Candidatus Yanofskybacteria bacterium]